MITITGNKGLIKIKGQHSVWIDCFPKAEFGGSLFCGGISGPGEADGKSAEQEEAYQFGKALE